MAVAPPPPTTWQNVLHAAATVAKNHWDVILAVVLTALVVKIL